MQLPTETAKHFYDAAGVSIYVGGGGHNMLSVFDFFS